MVARARGLASLSALVLLASFASAGPASATAYLGLKTSDAPAALGGGAIVAAAAPGSPALAAGLAPNDVIIGFDGQRIANADALSAAVAAKNPGDIVTLAVLRLGPQGWRQLSIRATLGAAPAGGPSAPFPAAAPPLPAANPPAIPAAGPAPASSVAQSPIAVSGWIRATEPTQQAFTIEIPQGWALAAGVPATRATASVVLSSPDNSVWMTLNDPRLMPLVNFPVNGGLALPGSIPYIPAPYFIQAFGATFVGEQCQSPKLERVRLRNDVAQGVDAAFSVRGGQSAAADAIFSCQRSGRPAAAYMAIVTHLYQPGPTLQFWQVDLEEIAIAPSAEIAAAVADMSQSWGSIQWSQTWVAGREQQQWAEMQAAAQSLDETLHQSQQVDDIINGVGDYFNPATGQGVQAPLGFERYCQNGAGVVFGENGSAIQPNCQGLNAAP